MSAEQIYDLLMTLFGNPPEHPRNGFDPESDAAWIYVDGALVMLGYVRPGYWWAHVGGSGQVSGESAVWVLRRARDLFVEDLRGTMLDDLANRMETWRIG